MVVSQTRPRQGLCNSPANGFPSGKDSISQAQWKNKHSGELHRGFGREAIPGRSPVEVSGGFSPKPCSAPMAQPPRTRFALFPSWGMGGNRALPSPAPSEKTFSSSCSVLPKEGAFPIPPLRPGSRFPSLWINPARRASLVQRLSLPPGEHGNTKEALLHCPPTAPTHRASDPAPHSLPRPFSSHKYSSVYTPPAFGGGVSFPPPALVSAAEGLKRVLTVFTGVRSASPKHTNPGQKSLWEKKGEMPGYKAPSQTSDRNLPR